MTRLGSRNACCANKKETLCFAWFFLSFSSSHSKLIFFMDIIYYMYGGKSNIKIWLLTSSEGHLLSCRCSRKAARGDGLLMPCYWLCQDNKLEIYGQMTRQTKRVIEEMVRRIVERFNPENSNSWDIRM